MKKALSVIITFLTVLLITIPALAVDYSFLDDMTLEELTALKNELENRIKVAKTAGATTGDNGVWELRYYVDEFKNPTSEGYIRNKNKIIGTFSNSATTNSELEVVWLIDKDDIALILYEYGRNQVKSSYDSTSYSIVMLDPDGKRIEMTGTMYKGGDRIYFAEKDESTVIEALSKNGSVTFKIVEMGKYASSDYFFKMEDTSYFSNAYSQLK